MKPPVSLDFIPGRWPGRLAMALALLAAAAILWQTLELSASRTRWQQARAAADGKLARAQARARPQAPNRDRIERELQSDALARRLVAPWSQWFAALEDQTTRRVSLRRLERDAAGGLSVVAHAANAEAMLDYLDALQQDRRLGDVRLVGHQTMVYEDGSRVEFQLSAQASSPTLIDDAALPMGARR